jgi:hypothetical protein
MKALTTSAAIIVVALFLIPAAGFAWEAGRPDGLAGADEQTRCPVLRGTGCPASAAIALSQLAIAAEKGCPFSKTRLIEQAQRCTDETTAGLARKAAGGDQEAMTELIQRVRTAKPVAPSPVDRDNVA